MAIKLRHALSAAVLTALMAGSVLVPANIAVASIGSCSNLVEDNDYWVYCNGSGATHQFRAFARCYRIGSEQYVTRYGVWRIAGGGVQSIAYCLSNEEVSPGGAQIRTV